jgi:hypothetical protein
MAVYLQAHPQFKLSIGKFVRFTEDEWETIKKRAESKKLHPIALIREIIRSDLRKKEHITD